MKNRFALLITILVLSGLVWLLVVIPYARHVGASALQPPQRTYTTNADFAEGTLVGLEYNTIPNQLQVAVESGVLPFIWVPNSNEGTISKVDTSTGRELGRYRTAPSNTTPNPSRTTVDLQGNCWVGNRQTATAVKVGLLESGQCMDRNANGMIETSRDLDNDGNIQGTELLTWGQDECVLTEVVLIAGQERNYVPGAFAGPYANDYWNPGPRGIAIDASGNVWVGTYGTKKYYYINGATGQIMRTIDVSSANHTPYGAVIDRNGILWSSGYDDNAANADLLRLNPADNSFMATNLGHQVYGIGLDRNNHLFVSAYNQQKLSRVNVLTGQKEWTRDGTGDDYQARGIAVTSDGDVWVANTGSGKVTRWSNDGVKKTAIVVGNSPTGVAVDAAGKIWVVNNGDDYIKRIDPATNAVDLEKHILGTTHYGYSDMTGFVSRTVTTRTGTWTAVYDSQAASTPWGVISWNSAEPAGTSIRARVRSSANQTSWSEWEQVVKGIALSATPANRYLQIEVTLQISTGDVSPVLYDLTIASGSGGGACNFAVAPTSQSFAATAGQGSVNVTVGAGCNWTSLSGYSWITINSGATGTGSGTVSYTVAANTEASSRIGSLLVAGQFVVIAQAGAGMNCPVTPLAIPQTVTGSLVAGDCRSVIDAGAYGDLYSFTASAGQRVAITLGSTQFDAFLTLISPDGSILAANDDNNSSVSTDSRIPPGSDYFVLPLGGTYIVEASSFNDNEVGSYTLSLTAPPGGQTCTYAITPASQAFTAAGGNGSANVTTSAGCGWTAGSNVSWITISAGMSGAGNGTVSYTVEANISLGYRLGKLLIGGQVLTVIQAGTGGNCTITPLVIPQTVNASWAPGDCPSGSGSLTDLYSFSGQAGQQVAISLTTANTFTSLYLFLPNGLTIFTEGNGNLRIPSGSNFFVLPYTGTYIVEAGAAGAGNYTLSLTVPSVSTCTYTIGPTSQSFAAAGGAGSVNVTTQSGCAWTATSNAAWITITGGASGSGTGTVNYTVAANTGAQRTGTLTIAGQIFTVTQAGTGGALTLVDHLTTAGPISTTSCSLPPPKANFASTEARVYHWFYVLNPQAGDTIRWEFVQPNGTIYNTSSRTNNFTGDTCAWAWIDIAGQSAASLPGAWQVRAFWNDVLLTTDSFNILAVNNCPTVSGINPISGAAGSTVTITGANFTGVTAVKFANNVAAQFTINSDTQITATIPVGAVTGSIRISKANCADEQTATFTVSVIPGNCVTAPAGAIAWLPGDGNANDLTGMHNGTLQNGATATAAGKVGQAFSFDGVNDFVGLGNFSAGAQWTLEAWVNPASVPANRRAILGGMNDCSDWALVLENGQWGVAYKPSSGACTATATSGITAVAGTWYHLVATNDGTTARIYVNGELKGSGTVAAGATGTIAGTYVGGNVCCTEFFPGLVDEATIYNRALSMAEIQGIYNADSAGKCKTTQVCTPVTGLNVNRLCNPDAELGPGATVKSQVVPIPGWTTTSNFTATRYDADGSLTVAEGQAIGGGTNFFYGGDTNASSTATQLVNVADEAAGIDAGQRTAQLQAYLGGFGGDNAGVRAEFLSAGGTVLGTALLLGPRSDDMQLLSTTGQVPTGTRTIRVIMTSTRVGGDDNEGYFDNLSLRLTQSGAGTCPTVSNLNPASGAVGSTVTITGANFTGVTSVKFASNVSAAFTVNSDTQITATVPSGAVTGAITISKTGCNDVQTAAFTITVPPVCPTVSGISPASGAIGGTVTITGANFTGVTSVKFASNVSAAFTVNSDTQITATVPSGAVTGPITISKTGCNDVQTASFTVSTGPCITVAIATTLTGTSGGSLTVPIIASDTTGKGALSYDFTLSYDPAVLRLQATPFDRTGTLSAAMTVTTNTSVAGQLRLSAFGTNPLAGAGTLLNLKFDLIGAVSTCSNLTWVSFRFNEGTPCATTTNGRACAVGGAISGAVNYCVTPKPVPGVTVTAAGTPSATSTTGSAGTYQLSGLGGGAYTVTPTKTGEVNGIASFDAALVAQHVVNIISLTSCQQLAGDTSNNGELSSFDAALIAQYVVGINNPASIAGTWKFVPPSRSYASLSGDQINQNFDAVLVGDVSGNWVAGAALAEAAAPLDEWLSQQAVQVSLPSLVAGSGTSLVLPVTVGDLTGRGVLAYDFDLVYDANLLQAQSQPVDAADTLSSNFTITPNATPGRLRVSGFGTMPLAGSGVLLKLRFNVIGTVGNSTALTWQKFQFNEGNPAANTVNGNVTVINIYTLSLTPSSQTIALGGSGSLTLVSSVAQPVPVTYPLASSNPAIASIPASVTIPANTTMATIAVMPNTVGGPVTITAGFAPLPGAPVATATVTVIRPVTSVSAASFLGQTLASEAIIAAFGTSLATRIEIATTVPLPTQLAGTTVQVRDSAGVARLAPLFFVSDGQINYQIPEGTAGGTAIVTVTSGNGTVSTGAIAITSVAPGLFTANATGQGVAAAVALRVKADGTQIYEPVSQWDAGLLRYVSIPIDLGPEGEQVYLILFGTGLRFLSSQSAASAMIGGSGIPVLFVGPQGDYVGLDQVNLGPIPRSLTGRGEIDVALTVDGKAANPVKVNIR